MRFWLFEVQYFCGMIRATFFMAGDGLATMSILKVERYGKMRRSKKA